jgi:6-phosphogluconolactonase (cycloisomerase 2 family)
MESGMCSQLKRRSAHFLAPLAVLGALAVILSACSKKSDSKSPDKTFVYAASQSDNTIDAYELKSSSGALEAVSGSPFAGGSGPDALAATPDGNFLFATNLKDNTVSSFEIDSKDGSLSLASTAGTLLSPGTVVVSSDGAYLYIGSRGTAAYEGFSIDPKTGALTPIAGFTASSGGTPIAALVDPRGEFLFSLQDDAANIAGFSIQGDGTLVSTGNTVATGSSPRALAFEPNGKYLYATSLGDSVVTGYFLDVSTGDLSILATSPFSTDTQPFGIAITPSGSYLYASFVTGINMFARNASNGALIALDTSPFEALGRPGKLAIDPSGNVLIVCDPTDDIIRMYMIDSDNGTLTKADDSPETAGFGPNAVLMVTP